MPVVIGIIVAVIIFFVVKSKISQAKLEREADMLNELREHELPNTIPALREAIEKGNPSAALYKNNCLQKLVKLKIEQYENGQIDVTKAEGEDSLGLFIKDLADYAHSMVPTLWGGYDKHFSLYLSMDSIDDYKFAKAYTMASTELVNMKDAALKKAIEEYNDPYASMQAVYKYADYLREGRVCERDAVAARKYYEMFLSFTEHYIGKQDANDPYNNDYAHTIEKLMQVVEPDIRYYELLGLRIGLLFTKTAPKFYPQCYLQNLFFNFIQMNYDDFTGLGQNLEQDLILYMDASEQGIEYASYMLGYFYENGLYVKKDMEKALAYYDKAADAIYEAALQIENYYYEMQKNATGAELNNYKALEGKACRRRQAVQNSIISKYGSNWLNISSESLIRENTTETIATPKVEAVMNSGSNSLFADLLPTVETSNRVEWPEHFSRNGRSYRLDWAGISSADYLDMENSERITVWDYEMRHGNFVPWMD